MPMGLALKQLTQSPAGSLSGLQWVLPITAPRGFGYGDTIHSTVTTATMDGAIGQLYSVTLRFRGVVEQKDYIGGTNDGAYFQIGGTPDSGTYNIYQLTISNPNSVYYLNRGHSGQLVSYAIDYTKTITIAGGATVTLFAASIDDQEIYNSNTPVNGFNPSTAFSIPGIINPAQPYNGQFIQMDVVSVT